MTVYDLFGNEVAPPPPGAEIGPETGEEEAMLALEEMVQPRMFDPGPRVPTLRELSYQQRLTIRRRKLLEQGRNPATGRAFAHPPQIGAGLTCRSCFHAFQQGGTRVNYWKCELNASRSCATDIRVNWPACTAYHPRGAPTWPEES